MKTFKDYILSFPSSQYLTEAGKPKLVGYEFRRSQDIRFMARDEKVIEAKLSGEEKASVPELTKGGRVCWIQGEDGKSRPYSMATAMEILGVPERKLETLLKPYMDKIDKDAHNMEGVIKEYTWRSKRDDPEDPSYEDMSSISKDPVKVYKYALYDMKRTNVKEENAIFTKIGDCYVSLVMSDKPKDVSLINAIGTLKWNNLPCIDFKKMKAIAKV
jgi:hypothetical protein